MTNYQGKKIKKIKIHFLPEGICQIQRKICENEC